MTDQDNPGPTYIIGECFTAPAVPQQVGRHYFPSDVWETYSQDIDTFSANTYNVYFVAHIKRADKGTVFHVRWSYSGAHLSPIHFATTPWSCEDTYYTAELSRVAPSLESGSYSASFYVNHKLELVKDFKIREWGP